MRNMNGQSENDAKFNPEAEKRLRAVLRGEITGSDHRFTPGQRSEQPAAVNTGSRTTATH